MVVLLVLLTFAVFITIDLVREHRLSAALLREGEALHDAVTAAEPTYAAGYRMPQFLNYHPGHTWVHMVGPDLAYVGVDDFARRLVGKEGRFALPSAGTHLAQGQPAISLQRKDQKARLLVPVGGEIVGVNPALKENPDLAHTDPYGRGWLFKIKSPHLFKDLGNLLNGSLAHRWMEDTRDHFQYRMMLASGSVLQDGGSPVDDIAEVVTPEQWQNLADEFLSRRSPNRPVR